MRQRLGLAHALLGDPEVLILDEPANGLDPEGIRWMRGLLRDFADRGGTVLLSSHLLLEVEAVADQLLIIGNGRIVADGSREELLAGTGMLVRATDADALAERARGRRPRRYQHVEDGAFVVDAEAEAVGRAALDGRVVLTHLGPSEGAGLETALLRAHRGARMTVSFPRLTVRRAAQDGRHPRRLLAAAGRRAATLAVVIAVLHLRRRPTTLIFRDAVRARDPARRDPAADHRHPARQLRVVAAHRADHVHARPASACG